MRVWICLSVLLVLGPTFSQDTTTPATDSSQLPAEVMPLATQSLLLDIAQSGDRMIAVGERGHVLLSDDQGKSWRQASSVPTRSSLTALTVVEDHVWAVGHDVIILHSSDRGENWEIQQVDPEMMQPLLEVFFLDETQGFAVGAYGYYLRTRDGGGTWEEGLVMAEEEAEPADSAGESEEDPSAGNYDFSDYEDEFTDFHMNGMTRLADGTLYIAAEAGNGLRSVDGGESWTNIALPYEGSMFGVLVAEDGALVTYGLRGHVLESVDGGQTWIEQETGTLNSLLGATNLEDGSLALVGANGEVLIRETGGAYRSTRTEAGDDLAAVVPGDDGELVLVGEEGISTHSVTGGTP